MTTTISENHQKNSQTELKRDNEAQYLLKKTYTCPVCDKTFKALTVKAARPRLLRRDMDMRPVYQHIDIVKYDSIVCENCGYAALSQYFERLSETQVKTIRTDVSQKFQGIEPAGQTYTYAEAILRYKLALANAIIKRGKISERAYICLKIAWLYRGEREIESEDEGKRKKLYNLEMDYIKKAQNGFQEASMNETFPIAGMDEWTFDFLLAELSIECGEPASALKLLSSIIISRTAPDRVKERARELRDYLHEIE